MKGSDYVPGGQALLKYIAIDAYAFPIVDGVAALGIATKLAGREYSKLVEHSHAPSP